MILGVIIVHTVTNTRSAISVTENGRAPWLTCLWNAASFPCPTFSGLRLVALSQLGLVKLSTFVETLVGTQSPVQTRVFLPHVKQSRIVNVWDWMTVRELQIYVFKTNVGFAEFNLDKEQFYAREIFCGSPRTFLVYGVKN